MTPAKTGESPACAITRLNITIEQKLDFAFSYQEEDKLLTLRSLLGLVRRLIHIRENFDSHDLDVLRIPLRREEKCVGASLKEIDRESIQGRSYTLESHERTGRSLVVIKGASREDIDSLIESCLGYVKKKLAE